MQMNSPQMKNIRRKEYNSKLKRQWSQKALHGHHLYDLSQQYVDIEVSNK